MAWRVIRLTAEAERDEGWRQAGEPLWPERWPMAELAPIKAADATVWEASYQQKPTVAGGYWFAAIQPNVYEEVKPRELNVYMVCDPALAKHKQADFTTIFVFGTGQDRNFYWLDLVRLRLSPSERADHLFRLHRKWRPIYCGYEEYGLQSDIVSLREKQERENYRFTITELGRKGQWHQLSKEDRIRTLLPLANTGRIWLPNPGTPARDPVVVADVTYFIRDEWNRFPASKFDDILDAMSRMNDPDMHVSWPMPSGWAEIPSSRHAGTSWMSA